MKSLSMPPTNRSSPGLRTQESRRDTCWWYRICGYAGTEDNNALEALGGNLVSVQVTLPVRIERCPDLRLNNFKHNFLGDSGKARLWIPTPKVREHYLRFLPVLDTHLKLSTSFTGTHEALGADDFHKVDLDGSIPSRATIRPIEPSS